MASLGASWVVFGASWRSREPLAYLGEPLGASWGSLGSLLEASWAPLGASWGPLGALLGRFWELSRRSWGHLGGDLSKKGGDPIRVAPLECLESPLGHRQEAKILPKPKENQCFVLSRLFASDGHPRPQDGSKMAQEGPKRGPREAQDGPKSAQERPKSAQRGRHEAILGALEGQG